MSLSFFRKYQGAMLIVFGILLMIVFTMGDVVSRFGNNGGRNLVSPTTVVATWRGGKANESQLRTWRTRYITMVRFVSEVERKTRLAKGNPQVRGVGYGGIPQNANELELVRQQMLASKAAEMGIVITKEAIGDYLVKLSDNTMTRSSLVEMAAEMGKDNNISQTAVLDQLRTALLAQNVRMLAQSEMGSVPPEAAWEYFNRLNRRVTAELYPVSVDSFLAEITEKPTEKQLLAFYEKHKSDYENPTSATPGFRTRPRAKFDYIKFDYEKFLESEMDNIDEAEVLEYYEKNKDFFIQAPKPETTDPDNFEPDGTPPGPEETTEPETTEPEATEPKATEPEATEPEATEPEATEPEGTEPEGTEPEGTEPEGTEPEGTEPEGTEPEATEPEATEPEATEPEATEPEANENSAVKSSDPAVACQDEEEDPKTEDPKTEEPKTEDPKTEDPKTEDPKTEDPKTEDPNIEIPKLDIPKVEVEYKPLSEVKDQILRSLAGAEAQSKMNAAMEAAEKSLKEYSYDYNDWLGQNPDIENLDPDIENLEPKYEETRNADQDTLEEIAFKADAELGGTPLVDDFEVEDTEIGQVKLYGMHPFNRFAFNPDQEIYEPMMIRKDHNISFLFWKSKVVGSVEPPLEEIRDKVEKAWKRQFALKLAVKAAEKISKDAKAKASLVDAVGLEKADKVIQTGAFAWLTRSAAQFGMRGQAPQLSSVNGVEMVGEEFMKSVFALSANECGIAKNAPETLVYAVRVVEESPSINVRRQMFLMTGQSQEVTSMAINEQMSTATDWIVDVEAEMKVVWKRPAQYR